MTKKQFIIANLLKKLGILRKQKRLQDAATELQLLREAEGILGRNVWQNVKNLEQYKVNHYRISKLLKEKSEYSDKIQEIKERINTFNNNQETRFKSANKSDKDIEGLYEKQKAIVNKIKVEQTEISDLAANIKRRYDGVIAKLEIITIDDSLEDNATEIDAENAKLHQLKNKFAELKEKKRLTDKKLTKQSAILAKISESLKNSKITHKDTAVDNYEIMGKANKAISAYLSKIGLLDNQIINHYNEIGKNISKECFIDRDCKKAVANKFNLCKIIKSLRSSIDYNHTLADR